MSNIIKPDKQRIFINSSQGRIFDFNNISSRVYLGDAVNSLLRVFGDNCIITGFRILNAVYSDDDIISITISSGEAIINSTLIKYIESIELRIDVSGLDDSGLIIPNIFFNFITTQQKNLSSIRLTYLNSSGYSPYSSWFTEYSYIVLAVLEFDKMAKTVFKRPIYVLNQEKININNKQYTIYPFDNISKKILMYLNDTFN